MSTEIAVHRVAAARQRISIDDADVLAIVNLTVENRFERRSDECIDIGRRFHLAACNGDRARQIDSTLVEQPTEENHRRRLDHPHDFALVHGVEMVHLNAHVACRTRTVENRNFHVLRIQQCVGGLLRTHAEIGFRHLRQRRQTRLPVVFLTCQFKLEVAGQRLVAQSRDENRLRRVGRVRHHRVGQLVDVTEQSGLQQHILHVLARQRVHILLAELRKILLLVGLHLHAKHLATLAALHRRHHTAHRRSKLHLRAVLIDEQRLSSLDAVVLAHHHLRRDAREVIRHERKLRTLPDAQLPLLGLASQLNVQAFA